jgi:DNA-binding beta-propeller fold protein YncE
MFAKRTILLALLSATGYAQQVRPGALSYVYDSETSRVRPVWGVASSAYLGDVLEWGTDLVGAVSAPSQNYVLALSSKSGKARIWISGAEALVDLASVPSGVTQFAISPEGTSAVFYYAESNRIHVVGGLPNNPVTVFDAPLSSLLNPIRLLAVSDDGSVVLATESLVSGHVAPAVVSVGANGVGSRIALAGEATAIAFLSNSHDAILSSLPEAAMIRDASVQASRSELPTAAQGALGVVASYDRSQALFANAARGSVAVVDIERNIEIAELECGCAPTGIYRTAETSVYRINEYLGGPVALVDASSSQLRMLVIPPLATPDNQ